MQERPNITEEEFAAILEKHSHLAEYDVVTKLLESIPEDCPPDLVDSLIKENQGNYKIEIIMILARMALLFDIFYL